MINLVRYIVASAFIKLYSFLEVSQCQDIDTYDHALWCASHISLHGECDCGSSDRRSPKE